MQLYCLFEKLGCLHHKCQTKQSTNNYNIDYKMKTKTEHGKIEQQPEL